MTTVGPTSFYYNTPESELKTHYGDDFEQSIKHKITSQFPKDVVLIRLAAIAIFGTILALSTPAWMRPVVVIASGAYACWTAYNHLLRQDPLVELFYKIVGGKDQYDELPEVILGTKTVPENIERLDWDTLDEGMYRANTEDGRRILIAAGGTTIDENIERLDWDALDENMYRANTKDGRRILIVKALTRNPESGSHVKTIFGFVEKYGPADLPLPKTHNRPLESLLNGLCLTLNENIFSLRSFCGFETSRRRTYISAHMTHEVANEFLAQMG